MCGRYVAPGEAALERHYHLGRHNWSGWIARWNVGPTVRVPIVYAPQGEPVGDLARWGLIPSWWSRDTLPALSFNARSEEAAGKPMWRQGMRAARCLMPAQGWYEWNEREPVRTASGRRANQPYYFHCPDEEVVSIAGLWSVWRAPDGADVLSCALLTREAAPAIASIHHRMPVVLAPSAYADWLAPRTSPAEVAAMIAGSRADIVAHRVSTRVNSTRDDTPELIEAVPEAAEDSRP